LYNARVQRRRLTTRIVFAVLVGLIVIGDATAARASMLAMACCAKTHGECAGVKRPDDCCRGMGHVSADPAKTTPPSGPSLETSCLRAVLAQPAVADSAIRACPVFDVVAFKRPHDPPHLHAFALLI
jgi:hypothetical protein